MTGITSNIEDVIAKFSIAAENAASIDFSEALIAGLNAAMAKMKFRIFNEGLDANGVPFGIYVGKRLRTFTFKKTTDKKRIAENRRRFTIYELKRLKRGRQVVYKDLEFEGDLRRAIKIVKESNKRVVCIIGNVKLSAIAEAQEIQIYEIRGGYKVKGKAPIFVFSAQEKEILINNTNAILKQIYARIIPAA